MAGNSLSSIVSGTLINRFRGLLQGASSSSSVKAALSGQSSTVSISDGLRLGARTYGTAVQALSATASFANLARATLADLDKLSDKMMALAERAASRQVGSQTRLSLDREFQKLGTEFREIVDNAKLNSKEYMTVEGLSNLFMEIGLDKETSDSMAEVFGRFVISDEDDALASEKLKGKRPVPIPPGALSTRASDTVYAVRKLTDYSITDGFISQTGSAFSDTDDILNQNPGYTAVFTQGLSGTVTTLPADSIAGNVTLLSVNESDGYSLIQSTADFLGYNAGNYNQLFLVDTTGNVIHQYTNNTSAQRTYKVADMSDDNKVVGYFSYDAGLLTGGVGKADFQGSEFGSDPAFLPVDIIPDGWSGLEESWVTKLKISNNGEYVAFINNNSRQVMFYQDTTLEAATGFLGSQALDFGFIGDNQLAVLNRSAGNARISTYTYNAGAYGTHLTAYLTGGSTAKFATLQANGGHAYAAMDYTSGTSRRIALYDVSDYASPVTTYDVPSGSSFTRLTLAYHSASDTDHVDIGIMGRLREYESAGAPELYRLTFNPRSESGTQLSRMITEYDDIFDRENSLKTRAGAYKMIEDLKTLKTQIKDNSEALEHAVEVLQKNIDVVRAFGLAFLDMSEQVKDADEADQVASRLQSMIRKNVNGSALNQLENLEAITVAALTYGTE